MNLHIMKSISICASGPRPNGRNRWLEIFNNKPCIANVIEACSVNDNIPIYVVIGINNLELKNYITENFPKIKFQDPEVTNIYGPKFLSFRMPRYLLVSQSSSPTLQAMWKLACEGTPATFGPLEALISAK